MPDIGAEITNTKVEMRARSECIERKSNSAYGSLYAKLESSDNALQWLIVAAGLGFGFLIGLGIAEAVGS